MYNAFWRLALFLRGQSFSVKTFDRSRNGCQVIREGAGNDFRGPSVQALPLPSRVSFSRARFFLCPLLASACYAGYAPLTIFFFFYLLPEKKLKCNICDPAKLISDDSSHEN